MNGTMNRVKTRVAAYGFVTPAVITLALLLLYPFCYGIYISFFKTNLVNKWNFIGLKNYAKVLTEADFYSSMKITLIFTVGVVLGHFIFGFLFAVMLNRDIKGRTVFRAILLLPWLFPEVVIANLWRWIFNPTMGFLNSTLVSMGILQEPMSWLGSPKLALAVLIFICIWKGYPLVMIQLLAGLQTVPGDIIEAARIDGATNWKTFWYVTVPSMKSTLSVTLILDVVWWFKHVTMIWLLTQGGPNGATNTIGVNIYKRAFEFFDFGPSSALAVVVFLICIVISILQRRLLKDE
ncbi:MULTISPECIES: carbohydrate ABC transporter permease [Hungatella]|jgi:multiple sugar transport system permease protein|nr:sugar ABC transporter permease [Hungatella hathewayi]RGM03251.1 sugar ABC transporter permease [Hungatella hathewayi]RGO68540.1 sugar ABC transporter permease [Hungatella hathewayi]RHM74702.1 sugar ABC transporter permease [Hungatella hathewayi]